MLWPLVGFTSLFTAFLVPASLSPGCGPLIYGVGGVPVTAFGQVRLPVVDIEGGVVSGVLLRRRATDGLAVCRIMVQGEIEGEDHLDA